MDGVHPNGTVYAIGAVWAPSGGCADGEYGWRVSASAADPFVNTASPSPGLGNLYLWLECAIPDGWGAAEFDVSGPLPVLSFTPMNGALNAGTATELLLAVGGCPGGPFLAGSFLVDDPGAGGNLCLVESSAHGWNVTVDCTGSTTYPNAVTGFASDGSPPCNPSDCAYVEPVWGLEARIQAFTSTGVLLTQWTPEAGAGIAAGGAHVFVSDSGGDRILRYDAEGNLVLEWGTEGTGEGELDGPRGLALDGATLFVAEENNDRVQRFTTAGGYLTRWGSTGSAPGEFSGPRDVAVDPQGDVFVLDAGNHRVQKFSLTVSVESRSWGGVKGAYR